MPEVELYENGLPCVNPFRHNQDPKTHYPLLNYAGTGCGELGYDKSYS